MSVKKVTDLGAPRLGELGLSLVDVRADYSSPVGRSSKIGLLKPTEKPQGRDLGRPLLFSPLRDAGGTCRLWFLGTVLLIKYGSGSVSNA